MITIKTKDDIAKLREGGKRLFHVLSRLAKEVAPGVSAAHLNALAERWVIEQADVPAFLHYRPAGASRPFPASLCVSINDEIVHGVPNEHPKILQEGDIVSLDMGLIHEGLIVDSAITVAVGKVDDKAVKLMAATEESLKRGIKAARGGARVGDIGAAIAHYAEEQGFSIADELSGHGVGYEVHEDPFVPNMGMPGEGPILKPGMVIAIEPMFNEGGSKIIFDKKDGFTVRTKDGSRSAHFEHTILITDGAPEVLTKV